MSDERALMTRLRSRYARIAVRNGRRARTRAGSDKDS